MTLDQKQIMLNIFPRIPGLRTAGPVSDCEVYQAIQRPDGEWQRGKLLRIEKPYYERIDHEKHLKYPH